MAKSVTVRAAWIGAGAVIVAAIIYGVFALLDRDDGGDTTIVDVAGESPVIFTGEVGALTIKQEGSDSEARQAIEALRARLESTATEVTLTRDELQLLTAALDDLDMRTAAIKTLPDGRARFGGVVIGTPTVVISEHNRAVEAYRAQRIREAFAASRAAVEAYEASQDQGTEWSGKLDDNTVARIYVFAAQNARMFRDTEHLSLALSWARQAARINPSPDYRAVYAATLLDNGDARAALDEVIAAAEKNPEHVGLKEATEALKRVLESQGD